MGRESRLYGLQLRLSRALKPLSQDGSKLVMVVEPSETQFGGFWERPSQDHDSKKQPAGGKFAYKQDFGEKLVGKVAPVLAVWDWHADSLDLIDLGLKKQLHPAHPLFTPDNAGLLLTVYDLTRFKHGLSACLNRPCHVLHVPDYSQPLVCTHCT